ncbi:MAG: hypothetical protein JO057_12165 [Chloroflexi bacterium]|nr:hypothetical protein [Chloroflexota bacterium]
MNDLLLDECFVMPLALQPVYIVARTNLPERELADQPGADVLGHVAGLIPVNVDVS